MPTLPIGATTESAPRYPRLVAAACYAILVLTLGYPALTGGFLVSPISDQYIAGYPFREFAAAALKTTGVFPAWNPYLQGGLPYVAAMHGDVFYPTFLLRLVLPVDVAMTWGFLLHVFLAGYFAFLFLRATRLSFVSALVGGAAYMLSGPIVAYVAPGHDGKLFVSALLPLLLWALVHGVRDGRRWAWGAMALVVGLMVLSPHPQLLQYALLTGGAYGCFLVVGGRREQWLPWSHGLGRLGLAFGAVLAGGAIGAVQYLPVTRYVSFSPRAGGMASYAHATSYSMPPEEMVNFVLPEFSGILEHYWGRNGIHFHSEYLGVAVLLLAGAAFAGRAGRREVWFWAGVGAVALLWSLGGFTPFYQVPYALVPGTKFFRAPSTMMFVLALAIAVLAAHGVTALLARAVRARYLIGWGVTAGLLALLASAGGLRGLAEAVAVPQRLDAVTAAAPGMVLGAWRAALMVALLLGVLAAHRRGRLSAGVAGGLVLAVVALDLWSVEHRYWRYSPRAETLYAADPATTYLAQLPQPGRVLAGPLGPELAYHDPTLTGDALMVHRVRQLFGYHGNELARWSMLMGEGDEGARRVFGNPNFWRLTNLQYVLTNVDSMPLPGFTRVLGPVTTAAGTRVSLFRVPGEAPYAWVTTALLKASDGEALPVLLDAGRFDVRSVALFDTAAAVQPATLEALPAASDIAVHVAHYAAGRVVLELSRPAPAGAALVASENFYPGWHARVDGRPVEAYRADLTLVGVPLAAGARRVELVFRDPLVATGAVVTLLAAGLALLAVGSGAVLERRATARAAADQVPPSHRAVAGAA